MTNYDLKALLAQKQAEQDLSHQALAKTVQNILQDVYDRKDLKQALSAEALLAQINQRIIYWANDQRFDLNGLYSRKDDALGIIFGFEFDFAFNQNWADLPDLAPREIDHLAPYELSRFKSQVGYNFTAIDDLTFQDLALTLHDHELDNTKRVLSIGIEFTSSALAQRVNL